MADVAPRILAVIPAYNESGSLPGVIEAIRRCAPHWDVVVVDDGSTDGTGEAAACCGAIVLRLPVNLGIGGAVQAGLMYADRHRYDACLQIDGDGQHNPADSVRLLDHLFETGADVVIGSRFVNAGGYQSSAARRLGIRALRWMIHCLAGQRVTDPTSGQRAFARRAVLLLARDYPQQYPEPETVYVMLRAGLRLSELPVSMNPRLAGQSSIRPVHSVLYMLKVTVALLAHATTRPKAPA